MNQNDRDRRAIETILRQCGEASYPEIALRGGEGLASPLMEMVLEDKVERITLDGKSLYRLKEKADDGSL